MDKHSQDRGLLIFLCLCLAFATNVAFGLWRANQALHHQLDVRAASHARAAINQVRR